MADASTRPPKKTITPGAWQEARALVYAHRGRLALGLGLLLVNRLAGLVLPSSSKWVIDRVINQHHPELLLPLALAAGGATLVQAITGFGLSQILGVAAQRAITDMRRTVQAYVLRLPISYFDSTKSGILISRIMNDAEGIRNLVGTGLVQLVGGVVTAAIALGVLFYLNWRLTVIAILILACFGAALFFLPQAFVRNIGQFLLLRAGLGIFFGVLIPATNAIVGLSTPPELRGSAYGLTSSATAVGNAIGPLLGSTIAASLGYPAVFIATAGVLTLLGLWVIGLVREPVSNPPP